MKKVNHLFLLLSASFIICSATTTIINSSKTSFNNDCGVIKNHNPKRSVITPAKGTLSGGMNVKTKGDSGFTFKLDGYTVNAPSGYVLRMKNNLWRDSSFKLTAVSDWWGNRGRVGAEKTIYTYDANGANETTLVTDAYEKIVLPSQFDGYVYIPHDAFIGDPQSWCGGNYSGNNVPELGFQGENVDFSLGTIYSPGQNGQIFSPEWWTDTMTNKAFNPWNESTELSILPGYKNYDADQFSNEFLSSFTCDSTGVNAPTFIEGKSWETLKASYNNIGWISKQYMASEEANAEGNIVKQMYDRYDYVVSKYGYEDFMSRGVQPMRLQKVINSSNTSYDIVAVSVVFGAFGLLASTLLLKNKKEK